VPLRIYSFTQHRQTHVISTNNYKSSPVVAAAEPKTLCFSGSTAHTELNLRSRGSLVLLQRQLGSFCNYSYW